MSALAIRCQDKITEVLYPIEQLITKAKVGHQAGQAVNVLLYHCEAPKAAHLLHLFPASSHDVSSGRH